MLIGDWLGRRAMLTPDKVALIDTIRGSQAITYRMWNLAANRTANFLRALGVTKGDRVAVLASNCVAYLDIWFACGKLGAILQTLNWRLTPRELDGLIVDATPEVLVYGPEFLELVRAIRVEGSRGMKYIALDSTRRAASDDRSLYERERLGDSPPPPVELSWDDPWVLCYTGGTTGLPKGAILTHGNITWNSINTVMSWGLTPEDVTILSAALFHTGGLNVFTAPLVHIGGTSIVCRGFEPDAVFDLIRDAGVTLFFGVPTMFLALQQHPRWESADFSRLKLIISGGAPCPPTVFECFWERGFDFKTGYGLTEAGPNTFWLPTSEVRRKAGSVGFPLFHIDVQLRDREGRECGPDEVGELLIRGPHVCAGYWNRPEETAHDQGGLAPHRRSGATRRRGLLLHRRTAQGCDHLRWREYLPGRGGERAGVPPRGRRGRAHRRAGREVGRGDSSDRGAEAGAAARSRRPDCLQRRAAGALQAAEARCARRGAAQNRGR